MKYQIIGETLKDTQKATERALIIAVHLKRTMILTSVNR